MRWLWTDDCVHSSNLELRMKIRLAGSCLVASLFLVAAVHAQSAASTDEYTNNPKFQAALKEGNAQLKHRQPMAAEDAFKKANKIAGGRSVDCLEGLYAALMMEGSYKDAVAVATAFEAQATTPVLRSIAASDRGQALLRQGGEKPKPAQLDAAHAAFQDALTNYPKNLGAMFNDGAVLARMGKNDEARVQFQQCATLCKPTDPARLRAMHFADNPELSTHKMAPAFEVTALDGSKFNLDAMGGRVVLIDFWATWCGPCNEELPHMKKIAKEFAGQPLVIISVSWDADEEKWKQFVNKNEMTWVQYRDSDHKLGDQFNINAIPHYFTIDSDGVLTAEMMGSGSDVEGKLKKLLAKAKQAPVTLATSGGGN
jgi:thiol-disulfide isomerase/thioredoxin/Flp pilus assembly protein TadD